MARSSPKTKHASVWGSADGTSYSTLGNTSIVISGVLAEDLPADSPTYDESAYDATSTGIDFDEIDDLTALEISWRAGRQLLLVGGEIIYLRSAPPDLLEGLIRGRLGTRQTEHVAGTPFVVLLAHQAILLESPLFVPGREISYKLQAVEALRVSDISSQPVNTLTIQGLAFTPLTPSGLRQPSLRSEYSVSDDLEIVWCWHSDEFPQTGLGSQPLGNASGVSRPRGQFSVAIKDDGGSLIETLITTAPELVLTPSDRTALDGLPFWSVEVRQVEGSFTSGAAALTLIPA